jgi:hypothetical protein
MTRHEYNRNLNVRFVQLGREIETAQPWQPDVEDEAACHIPKVAPQQFGSRSKQFHPKADRSKQASERFAQGLVVVDDEDDWLFGCAWRSLMMGHEILARYEISSAENIISGS